MKQWQRYSFRSTAAEKLFAQKLSKWPPSQAVPLKQRPENQLSAELTEMNRNVEEIKPPSGYWPEPSPRI